GHSLLPDTRSSRATYGTNIGSSLGHGDAPSEEAHDPYTPPVAGTSVARQRPLSNLTQAASVIGADIVDATRVQLGFATPTTTPLRSPAQSPRGGAYRMTSARLVTPSSAAGIATLERQQERAMAEVQAARAAQQQARTGGEL